MIDSNFFESELVRLAIERHQDSVGEICQLMEYFADENVSQTAESDVMHKVGSGTLQSGPGALQSRSWNVQSSPSEFQGRSTLADAVGPEPRESDGRFDLRYPVCTKIRVTPCDNEFTLTGSSEVAYTQNLSAGGARILLADDPESEYLRVDFDNPALPFSLILKLNFKIPSGKFIEAGGEFIARL